MRNLDHKLAMLLLKQHTTWFPTPSQSRKWQQKHITWRHIDVLSNIVDEREKALLSGILRTVQCNMALTFLWKTSLIEIFVAIIYETGATTANIVLFYTCRLFSSFVFSFRVDLSFFLSGEIENEQKFVSFLFNLIHRLFSHLVFFRLKMNKSSFLSFCLIC